MTGKTPAEQFQIGDRVLYKPEGVLTRIRGYLWNETVGEAPKIIAYHLDCDITVDGTLIEKVRRQNGG